MVELPNFYTTKYGLNAKSDAKVSVTNNVNLMNEEVDDILAKDSNKTLNTSAGTHDNKKVIETPLTKPAAVLNIVHKDSTVTKDKSDEPSKPKQFKLKCSDNEIKKFAT